MANAPRLLREERPKTSLVDARPPPRAESGPRAYGLLSQTNPDFDADLARELEDLYVGGYRVRARARRYLRKVNNEHDSVFAERCEAAGYQGFFSQVVDQFVSEQFAQPLSVARPVRAGEPEPEASSDYYAEFERDADLRGHSFVDLAQGALRTALVQRWSVVLVDAPSIDEGFEPASRIDEERAGLDRLYAYELPVGALINWRRDPRTGRFLWAVVHAAEPAQADPFDAQGRCRETFTVWRLEGGLARWERYSIEYDERQPPRPDTLVSIEAEGVTRFKRVPLIPLELPDGLWVGNKVGPMQREHWQRRSTLIAAENRSLVSIPYVMLGPIVGAGGAIPSEVAQDDARGDDPRRQFERRGFMTLSAGDECGFMEPAGACYELVDGQLERLRETMLQVSHQMALSVSPSPGTAQRSGLSKQKDGESTSKVLRALGAKVRLFAVEVYRTISEARGEDADWVAHGLDTYEDDDRGLVLEEAAGASALEEAIPSPTFHKSYAKVLARKLHPGLSPAELQRVDAEIDDGVDERMERSSLERDAEAALAATPAPPSAPLAAGSKAK